MIIFRIFLQLIVLGWSDFVVHAQSLGIEPAKPLTSPSGSKTFEFIAKEVGGKTTYQRVDIPYTSQPVYVDFIDKMLNESGDSIETSLFEDEALTKLLGTVIVRYDGHLLKSVFKSINGKEIDFIPSFYQGRCRRGEQFSALHPLEEVKDRLGRLGEGPWGKNAWVKAKLIELDKLDLHFLYNGESFSNISFRREDFAEFSTFNSEVDQYFSFRMPAETLVNGSGNNFDFKLGCEKDFSNSPQVEPMIVNLAPPKFAPFDPNDHDYEMTPEDVRADTPCKLVEEKNGPYSPQQLSVNLDQPVDTLFLSYPESKILIYPNKISDQKYDFPSIRTNSAPILFFVKQDKNIKVSLYRSSILERKKKESYLSSIDFGPNEKVTKAKDELDKANKLQAKLLALPRKTIDDLTKFNEEFQKSMKQVQELESKYRYEIKEQKNERDEKIEELRLKAIQDQRSVIDMKIPPKHYMHKFTSSSFAQNSIIKIYVSNFELGQIVPAQSLNIDFAPGEYPMKIRTIKLNDESTEEYFNLVVNEDPKQQENIVDLAKVSTRKLFHLRHDQRSGNLESVWDKIKVKSVEKILFVSDRVVDLSGFFQPRAMTVQKPDELDKFLAQLESGSIVVEGTCHNTEPEFSFHSMTIHSTPSEKSTALGVLKLKHDKKDSDVFISFIRQDGYATAVKPNYYTQACQKTSSVLVLHQISKTQGEWSDLGHGPWGDSGWIKVAAKPLFNNDLVFEVPDVGYGKIKKKSNETYIFTPEDYYGADHDRKPKNVDRAKLIKSNGAVIPKIVCELGC